MNPDRTIDDAPRRAVVGLALAWLAAAACADPGAGARCDDDAVCGPCGRCVEGACQFDSAALAQSTCVAVAPDPCDGVDNDGNGVIDDPAGCWAAVWAFSGPDGARCFGLDGRRAPPTCRGYRAAGAGPAFWLASLPVPGTRPLVQCSHGEDHVLVSVDPAGWDGSAAAWAALGYDCTLTLGHAWAGAAPFAAGASPPDGGACPLTRWTAGPVATAPLGRHAVALGGARPDGDYTCAIGLAATVVARDPACAAGPPDACAAAACAPSVRGEVVAQELASDVVVAPGAALTQRWTVRNTGEATWPAAWVLAPLAPGSRALDAGARPLAAAVPPGGEVTLEVAFTAPDAGADVAEGWSLREEPGGAVLVALPFRYDVATDVAAELAWLIPVPTDAWPLERYGRFRLRLTNPSDRGWGPGFHLVRESGSVSRDADVPIPRVVYPYGEVEIDIPAIAPATAGVYRERWRLETGDGAVVPVDGAPSFTMVMTAADWGRHAVVLSETVPDGTPVAPGATFVKTWRLRSGGREDWQAGARLRHVDGRLALAEEIPIGSLWSPEGEIDVAVPLRVPPDAPPGATLTDRWELVDAKGLVNLFDEDDITLTVRPLSGPGWLWATVTAQAPCVPRPNDQEHAL